MHVSIYVYLFGGHLPMLFCLWIAYGIEEEILSSGVANFFCALDE